MNGAQGKGAERNGVEGPAAAPPGRDQAAAVRSADPPVVDGVAHAFEEGVAEPRRDGAEPVPQGQLDSFSLEQEMEFRRPPPPPLLR
jgi:hypothetical protein